MFTFVDDFMHSMLTCLGSVTHDWGIAIVVFTLGIRILMLPLSMKAAKSSIAQGKLALELKELKKSWHGSQVDLMKEQQRLAKVHGVRPIASLLVLVLQSPVFFMMYRLFRSINSPVTSVLVPWVSYITLADPFHIVPIVAALLIAAGTFVTYHQTHIGVPQLLGALISCAFTLVLLWGAPIAVSLYYTTSGVWGTAERFIFRKRFNSQTTCKRLS